MLESNYAVYLGKEEDEGFFGFIVQDNIFLVLSVEEGLTVESGRNVLDKLKEKISLNSFTNLASFDQFFTQSLKELNLPSFFSLSAGCQKGKIFYLKTIGQGTIFLKRESNFAKVLDQDNFASGYLENNDFFIFSVQRFVDVVGNEAKIKSFFDGKTPHEIIDYISPQMKAGDDKGVIALFVKFQEKKEDEILEPLKFLDEAKKYLLTTDKKKTITLILVAVIFIVLIWSVVLGFQRRNSAESEKKIKVAKELITQKLDQAEEVAFLNLARSQTLISEAKNELEKLKKETRGRKKEIAEIESLIKEKENKVVKKEEKNYEEFFDLTIDSKDAKADLLYLDSDTVSVLDKNKGIIYLLSLAKKSLDKKNSLQLKSAKLVASYQKEVIFFSDKEGIYKIGEDNKAKKVIEYDKDWGNITGIWIYNGNVYILDSGKGDVYKYLVTEGGYSAKNSYFKSAPDQNLKGANSLAIDSSLYIGFSDYGLKYSGGLRDEFKTSFSEEGINITKIFTSKDSEKIYAWDKNKGVVYILNKNGTYERQIKSSILNKGSDFVVFNNVAFVLSGAKIYKISLD